MAETVDFTTLTLTTNPLVSRLHQILSTCSQSIGTDDRLAVAPLFEFLNHIQESTNEKDDASRQDAEQVLNQILLYISSPSLDQAVIDALSFELPESVSKFAGISKECCEIAEFVVDQLILKCNPRDMLSIICEALDSETGMFNQPAYFSPLLTGVSKVFLCIQRRHFEQIKEAMPAILSVLEGVSYELDDDDEDSFSDFVDRALSIATSIEEVCYKLEGGRRKEQIRSLLGLFVLQIMALVSSRLGDRGSSCIQVVSQLSRFLPFCNMSYLGLITGDVVETFTRVILEADVEDNDDYMRCFSLVKHGSSLAVVWGHISDEVMKAAEEDLTVLRDNLLVSQSKRWKTVGMLKYVFASSNQPWKLKVHVISFLLYILDENICQKCDDKDADCSSYTTSLFAAVQAIENVIMYASDAALRKSAFGALKRVLADIPTDSRFDILKASITNSSCPSMTALLLGLVKNEISSCRKDLLSNDEMKPVDGKVCRSSPFWSEDVLELVEFVLNPPTRGPPSLPEQSDAVLSALNLYRFLLITESTGKTNYTGILSEDILQKAYREWLLPLRTLVTGTIVESEKNCDEFADHITCGLNPVQFVLYRCIELVEEKLRNCT